MRLLIFRTIPMRNATANVGESSLHAILVDRAVKWLKYTLHCRVVLQELVAYTKSGEIPDAVGWVHNKCVLIEVKTSRADFLAEKKKRARNEGKPALGHWRFYLTPEGLIRPEEIPDGWGLYEVCGKNVKHSGGKQYRNAIDPPLQSCRDSEIALLVSAFGRQHSSNDRSSLKSDRLNVN